MEHKYINCIQGSSDMIKAEYEPWLEMKHNHAHAGERVEVCLKWGRNMQSDLVPGKDGLTAMVIHPDGKREELLIQDGNESQYILAFDAPEEGCYQVIIKKTACYAVDQEGCYYRGRRREYPDAVRVVSYCQSAQIVIPVGHQMRKFPQGPDLPVKIQPSPESLWKVGKQINFTISVLGKKMENTTFDMAYNGFSGYKSWEEKTGEKGTFTFQPMQTGQYLLAVRTGPLPGDPGISDVLELTASFTLLV